MKDVFRVKESGLANIDRIVELRVKTRSTSNLSLHRAPGYCIADTHLDAPKVEPFDLWRDKEGEDAFVFHWDQLARRYKGVAAADLSFNLVNEPPVPVRTSTTEFERTALELQDEAFKRPVSKLTREDHRRVMARTTDKIRESSPDRTIIVDGLDIGASIVEEMMHTVVAQSVHTYLPLEISHYRASWVDARSDFPAPQWPATRRDGNGQVTRETLEELYAPWGWLVRRRRRSCRRGIAIACADFGRRAIIFNFSRSSAAIARRFLGLLCAYRRMRPNRDLFNVFPLRNALAPDQTVSFYLSQTCDPEARQGLSEERHDEARDHFRTDAIMSCRVTSGKVKERECLKKKRLSWNFACISLKVESLN